MAITLGHTYRWHATTIIHNDVSQSILSNVSVYTIFYCFIIHVLSMGLIELT